MFPLLFCRYSDDLVLQTLSPIIRTRICTLHTLTDCIQSADFSPLVNKQRAIYSVYLFRHRIPPVFPGCQSVLPYKLTTYPVSSSLRHALAPDCLRLIFRISDSAPKVCRQTLSKSQIRIAGFEPAYSDTTSHAESNRFSPQVPPRRLYP